MAVAFTHVDTADGVTTGLSVTSASIAAVSGQLYVLTVMSVGGGTISVAGTNGFNTTWTERAAVNISGDTSQRIHKFTAVAVSGVSGTITLTGTENDWGYAFILDRCDGSAHVQSVTGTGNGTTASATLAAFGNAANGTHLSVYISPERLSTWTPEATALHSRLVYFDVRSLHTTGNTGNDTTPSGTWTTASDWLAIGTEIAAGGGGATAAKTGTITAATTEADIVAGGKTIIDTLTGDTWLLAAGTPAFSVGTTKGTTAADVAGGGGGRTSNGTLTCTFPSGYTPTAGHFALMVLYSDQGTGSVPTDWTEVTGSPWGSATPKLQAFYKVLAGGESAPVTTISGSATNMSHCANMAIYADVKAIGAIGAASDGTGTPMTAAAITTTDANSIVCGLCGRGDNENASGQTFGGSATGVVERLDGGTAAGNDSQISMYDKVIATTATSSDNGSATTNITDPWVSVLIELVRTTPFADSRAAQRDGLVSAQSEGTGWNAVVKPNIPLANIVRTSDTVRTITLPAFASYNITASDVITDTIPGAALTGGTPIVATPTFTITVVGGGFSIIPIVHHLRQQGISP